MLGNGGVSKPQVFSIKAVHLMLHGRWRGQSIGADDLRACRGALLCFARAKKVGKEALFNSRMAGQHAPGGAPLRGSQSGRDFRKALARFAPKAGAHAFGACPFAGAKQCFAFIRLTHVPAENAAHPVRRPCGVLPGPLAAPKRGPEDQKRNAKATATATATANIAGRRCIFASASASASASAFAVAFAFRGPL